MPGEIAISAREHRQRAKMAGPFFVTAYGSEPILSNLPETRKKVADFEHVLHHTSEQVDKTIIGWYDASASNFSPDQRRAKLFVDRVYAEAVAYQLRRMYPRLTQDIEVTPAVQPTALVYSSNGRNRVAIV